MYSKLGRFFKKFRKKPSLDNHVFADCAVENFFHCKTCHRINKYKPSTNPTSQRPKNKVEISYFSGGAGSCLKRKEKEKSPISIAQVSRQPSLTYSTNENAKLNSKPSGSKFRVQSVVTNRKNCICQPTSTNQSRYQQIILGFHLLKKIGGGCLGNVYQAYRPTTKKYYALKILFKRRVFESNRFEKVIHENELSRVINFEFLTSLAHSFQDSHNFYLAFVPYCPGGNLLRYIELFGHLKEDAAKFYTAQVVLALEYLHSLELIHRDVKPENVVIASDGFVKLTDFGFCKRLKKKTFTVCGNPMYFAPEILAGKGYGKEIDWWALGVMLYELIVGRTPFYSPMITKVYEKIRLGKFRTVRIFSPQIRIFLKEILNPVPTQRLGVAGSADVKGHKFFGDISWEGLLEKKYAPPFVPPAMPTYDRYQSSRLRKYDLLPTMENDCWRKQCPETGKMFELSIEEIPDVMTKKDESERKSLIESRLKTIETLLIKRQGVRCAQIKKRFVRMLDKRNKESITKKPNQMEVERKSTVTKNETVEEKKNVESSISAFQQVEKTQYV